MIGYSKIIALSLFTHSNNKKILMPLFLFTSDSSSVLEIPLHDLFLLSIQISFDEFVQEASHSRKLGNS